MFIKRANIDDIDNLKEMVYNAYEMHYKERRDIFRIHNEDEVLCELKFVFSNQSSIVFMIEEDSTAIGYLIFRCIEKVTNSIWIDQFYIEEHYRNKGYGKALIDEVKKYARDNNIKRIELNCWTFNENAIEFYRHLGFKEQRIIFESEV